MVLNAGNGWEWMGMDGNGWEWMGMDDYQWRLYGIRIILPFPTFSTSEHQEDDRNSYYKATHQDPGRWVKDGQATLPRILDHW